MPKHRKMEDCLFGRKQRLSGYKYNYQQPASRLRKLNRKLRSYFGFKFEFFRASNLKIRFMARFRRQLSMKSKLLMNNSIAAPHLAFCSTSSKVYHQNQSNKNCTE